MISIYLIDGEKDSENNLAILAEVTALIKTLKGPWIVAGDFNMSPSELKATNWHRTAGGQIHAPSTATCLATIYDFFVVCNSLSPAVAGVQTIEDGGLYPHSPARLLIRANARRPAARRLRRPTKVPGKLPAGPAPKPPCYAKAREACAAGDTYTAVQEWYTSARHEWAALTGMADTYREPKFVWESAAGACAAQHAGNTSPATAWRILARRAAECTTILKKGP